MPQPMTELDVPGQSWQEKPGSDPSTEPLGPTPGCLLKGATVGKTITSRSSWQDAAGLCGKPSRRPRCLLGLFPHWLCFLTAASARGLLRAVPGEGPACEMAQPWAGSQLCRRDAGQVASRRLPTLGQAHDHTSASRGKFRGDVR